MRFTYVNLTSLEFAMRPLVALTAAALIAVAAVAPATAASAAPAAHHFKNCTDMHKTYRGGVAKKGAHDHRPHGGHARYAPHVSTALYNANKSSDRDRDGVACEQ
jgi:uncharacterized membrane protein